MSDQAKQTTFVARICRPSLPRDFQRLLPTRKNWSKESSTEIPMSSTIELSEDKYEQRMQAAVEKAFKKRATAAEVDALQYVA